MGLADLLPGRSEAGNMGTVEYGSDGSAWGGYAFTPWPGVINDAKEVGYVTREMATGLPGIGRGVELIAGVVSQLQPELLKDLHAVDLPTVSQGYPGLLLDPDPLWHGKDAWLSACTAALVWVGNAFAYKGPEVCDQRGYPMRLPLLDEELMSWEPRGGLYDGVGYVYRGGPSARVELEPGDVTHAIVGARAGRRMGEGILQRYQNELRMMFVTERAQFVVMKSGQPFGIISLNFDATEAEAKKMKESFVKSVAADGVAVMGGADFKPVQWSSADLSLIETRSFNLRLAADIVGISPYLLGVPSESRVYSNMETEWANFIRVTLGRYLSALESMLSRCFPRGKTVKFNVDELLRADSATRWAIYEKAITIGATTPAEVRQFERWSPKDGVSDKPVTDKPPTPALPAPTTDTQPEEAAS
jgi:HK97 family phage portal protein